MNEIKILLILVNPVDTGHLNLYREERKIKECSILNPCLKIETVPAARPADLISKIEKYKPHIVHFSGHGEGRKGLVFEDNRGQPQIVDSEALVNLFKYFAKEVKCVVLNSCYSEYQAKLISDYINYTIGMNSEIDDEVAINFAEAFYGNLNNIKTSNIESAYHEACLSLRLQGVKQDTEIVLFKNGNLFEKYFVIGSFSPNFFKDINYISDEKFYKTFGFYASPILRSAIDYCYKNSIKLQPHIFKEVKSFLDVDINTNKLKIVYSKSNRFFYYFGNILAIITSFVSIVFLCMFIYIHIIAIVPFISSFSFLIGIIHIFVRPYVLAKRIEQELQCM